MSRFLFLLVSVEWRSMLAITLVARMERQRNPGTASPNCTVVPGLRFASPGLPAGRTVAFTRKTRN